ncbi:cinnamoyl-CoA reductase-like SNL6 [Rutidosis leptorrhynchoides]|uniref:cinnamoyl-CoA reductase-like SNL6 n=1 Tax=Rutidosis leptorrhynchoides TaxID=125765 RepID=UPI003A99D414
MAPADDVSSSISTVCVMDASGRLGSGLVGRLLQQGYSVHAAVQNYGEEQFDELSFDKKDKLKIFYTDPFDYQSIADALKGCSGLFYSYEPPHDQPNYDEFMAEMEARAAHNVLEACAQTDTIDKVVFTSSATAVVWRDDVKLLSSDLDEKHWSDINFCRKYKLWHGLSKTLAEKAAWALAMDRGVSMISINAGLLLGTDVTLSNPYLKGAAEMYEDGVFVTVDLKFLVDAHINAFEDISSYGRYICFNHVINRHQDAMELAKMITPSDPSPPPQRSEEDIRIIPQKISNKKLNKMMVDFASKNDEMDQLL